MRGWRSKTVWVYQDPIDFRKQINGLIQVVLDRSEQGLDREAIYLFRNQRRDQVKILVWDRNGFFMGVKRLEKGKFEFPREGVSVRFTWDEFEALVLGVPLVMVKSQEKVIHYT